MFSLVCYGFQLLFAIFFFFLTDISMFSFRWLKRDWGPEECWSRSKLFYLRNVSRLTLLLAVNFQSDALRDLVPLVQFNPEKASWRGGGGDQVETPVVFPKLYFAERG